MRETIQINKNTLSIIMDWSMEDEKDILGIEEANNYEFIQKEILSVDYGDGGYNAIAIIKRKSDGKFFVLNYQQWDIDWEMGNWEDYEPELTEVFPVQKLVTIYE